MKRKITIALIGISGFLAACSSYSKVYKSDDYAKKLEYADNYYNTKKYSNAINLYEQVYQRYSKQPEGESAYFKIGKSYYMNEDYYMAGYFLGQFTQRFPFSTGVEEATFLSALCSVKNSPNYSLDQTETDLAINNLQQFVDKFPNSILVDSCNVIVSKLRDKLEIKDFEQVRLYDRTMNYRAAVTSSMIFISEHPVSVFREEAYFILVSNAILLTKNSVDNKKYERSLATIEHLRSFGLEYPESKYLKSFKTTKEEMEKEAEKYDDFR